MNRNEEENKVDCVLDGQALSRIMQEAGEAAISEGYDHLDKMSELASMMAGEGPSVMNDIRLVSYKSIVVRTAQTYVEEFANRINKLVIDAEGGTTPMAAEPPEQRETGADKWRRLVDSLKPSATKDNTQT